MTQRPDLPASVLEDADDTRNRVLELVREGLLVEVPNDEADLFETGLIDSLAFVELLLLIKTEFGVEVEIDDLEVDNFRSVTRITAFIVAQRASEPVPGS